MKKILLFTALIYLEALNANEILKMEANKMYIIDFFASWCVSCEKELPILSKMNEKFKANNIELIGIDVDKNKNDATKFQERMAKYLTFKVINDTSNQIINSYKPLGIPAVYIINNNTICGKIFGAVANLEEKINEQIKICEERK